MNETIRSFMEPGPIAVLGASGSPRKFGGQVVRALREGGYTVIAVNRNEAVLDGRKSYRSLADIPDPIENAVIVVRPEALGAAVEEAARRGIKRLWFQQGADFSAAAKLAESAGIACVTGKCILMYASPVKGIHRFHRTLARWFGRY